MIRADLLLSQALSELRKEDKEEAKEEGRIDRVISILQQLVIATKEQEQNISVSFDSPPITLNPNINVAPSPAPDVTVNIPPPEDPQITVNVPKIEIPATIVNVPEPIVNVTFQERESETKSEYEVEVERSPTGMISKLRIKQV